MTRKRKLVEDALGYCDRTGFRVYHKQLKKQMEWVGNQKVWTGLLVYEPFLDIPNEQNRPPLVKSDPTIVVNPRPNVPSPQAGNSGQMIAALQTIKQS